MKKANSGVNIIINLFCITAFIVALFLFAEYYIGKVPCVLCLQKKIACGLCLYQKYIYVSILGFSAFKLIQSLLLKMK